MSAQRWQRIKALVADALERPRAERAAFLDGACAGDAALREEVESLVAAGETSDAFLEAPAFEGHELEAQAAPGRNWIGRQIGPYRIVERFGAGGMGEVYKALRADEEFHQVVAIKLLRAGYDTGYVLERFRAERQILASLDHPNIARLLDGGITEEGLPYFVMEAIAGLPIDRYCNEKGLSVAGRLALFRTVCAAVQDAHQHLVVHRDIKPGNILVTADGTVKLLDFGIAKILDAQAAGAQATMTAMAAMTPEYASPEQIKGERVTTASDIYSLGVLLYQLLTGLWPYRTRTTQPHEVAQAIVETEPERPSAAVRRLAKDATGEGLLRPPQFSSTREPDAARLARRLDGDLDTIVLTALRKDPRRRYASAEQLGEDVQRYLEGMPILARQDSMRYVAGKFIARHRIGVALSAAVVASLVTGVVLAERSAQVARAQHARAERHLQAVRSLAHTFMFDVHDAIKDLPGATAARKLVVQHALRYLDPLAKQLGSDRALQREVAAGYERVASVMGGQGTGNLGDPEGAIATYRKAIAIREALVKEDAKDAAALRDLVRTRGQLANALYESGETESSLAQLRALLPVAERLARQTHDPKDRRMQAAAHLDLGGKLATRIAWKEGLQHVRQGVTLLEVLVRDQPQDKTAKRVLAVAYARAGSVLNDFAATPREAQPMMEKSLALAEELLGSDTSNADFITIGALARIGIGRSLMLQNDPGGAYPRLQQALIDLQALATADPGNVWIRYNMACAYSAVGEVLLKLGETQAALDHLELARASFQSLPAATLNGYTAQVFQGLNHHRLGKAYLAVVATHALPAEQKEAMLRAAREAFEAAAARLAEAVRRDDLAADERAAAEESKREATRLARELGADRHG